MFTFFKNIVGNRRKRKPILKYCIVVPYREGLDNECVSC